MQQSRWSIFKSIWKIQWDNYKKDSFNIFSGWVITTITLVVWLAFKNSGSMTYDEFVLASAIGISGIRNCLFNFHKTLHDFKSTLFFERLFNTKISKTFIFGTMILFNQIMNSCVTLFLVGLSMLFPEQRQSIQSVNWFSFFLGFILLLLMSNLIAFILAFTIKKYEIAAVYGNIYYFGSVYLLGLGIPYSTLSSSQTIIIISFLFPQRYVLNIMDSGWINDFYMQNESFGYNGNFWIPYVVSFILILVFLIILIFIFRRKFEYENKKYKRYSNTKKHLAIIYSIKRASTISELEEAMKIWNSLLPKNEKMKKLRIKKIKIKKIKKGE
ncbi:ABC transporter permease [Spiroplasma taiwanense]|uniref:ABC-2 type transporter transmembrane domain-containing protein n=1 Tax=Spiroplasma taiwanense CT-1 TaxID=1276220 RepID=S5MCK0_9MOLU|nr:ABC transporter permease [Spiroplasma taiwanense]AGR41448.1 hypothetical protein STAIW_v1c08620 [Spiroplasma taiwanense CT-1]